MGAAYFIVLEKKIDGLDTMMDGKSLSRHLEALDEAAKKLGVRPLSEFYSVSTDELADSLGEEELVDSKPWPSEHFSAQDGLATVRALLGYAPAHADHVVMDLRECERILTVAAEHGIGWRFQIDV
jgi:hypothetical protein